MNETSNNLNSVEAQLKGNWEKMAQLQQQMQALMQEQQRLQAQQQQIAQSQALQATAPQPRPAVQAQPQAQPQPQPYAKAQPRPQVTPQAQVQYRPQPQPQAYQAQPRSAVQPGPAPRPAAQTQAPQAQPRVQLQSQPSSGKSDLEHTFSKAILPICASILIFISAICLAVAALPILSELAKLLLMFFVSGIIILGGALLSHHDKQNKVYRSILACGMGGLYITLFMGDIYFKMIGDAALYFGLMLWTVLLVLLSRTSSASFLIIGEIGVLIATSLGAVTCARNSETLKLVLVCIYVLITQLIYRFTKLGKGEFARNFVAACTCVFTTIMVSALCSISSIFAEYISIEAVTVIFVIIGYLCNNWAYKITAFCYSIALIFPNMAAGPTVLWVLAIYAAFLLMEHLRKEQYDISIKITMYSWFLPIFMWSLLRYVEADNAITEPYYYLGYESILLVGALINIVMLNVGAFHRDLKTKEPELGFKITGYIFNGLMWACASFYIFVIYVDNTKPTVMAVLAILALTLAGTVKLWGRYGNIFSIGYILRILFITSLLALAYHWKGYLLSVLWILISMVAIVLGFILEEKCATSYKPVRIMCLVVTMVSLMKLLLFDLRYNSSLMHAVAFFCGGVLCFIISLIYTYIDKRMHRPKGNL